MTHELLLLLPTVASLALYMLMMGGFFYAKAHQRRPKLPDRAPRVTILKPLAGDDEELATNLASFAAIDYPSFEILIGVASLDDPAYPVARAFVAAHPKLDVRIVHTDPDAAINPKVAQLIDLDARATGEIVVVSDGNVRVPPSYLWSLVSALDAPDVALATSVVAGTGERTLGAALENLQLGALVAPGVVASSVIANKTLAVGKSMAIWRKELVRVGGFRRVGSVLAEDFLLGRIFREAGCRVAVVLQPVENRNVACSVTRTLERHTRWAKMRRAIVPRAFFLEPLLSPLLVASATFLVAPCRTTALLLLFTLSAQTLLAMMALRLVRGCTLQLRYLPLEMMRTYMLFACWMRACISRRVSWRGHPFLIGRDTAIVPIGGRAAHRLDPSL